MAPQPRRPRHGDRAGDAQRSPAPGSAGPATPATAPEPFDEDGIHLHPVPLSADEVERLLRGLLQRHPLAALPRRHRAGRPSTASGGELPDGQPALRRGRRRGRGRRAPPCGCRTTSCSSCRRCCASCGPTCASAASTTSRSRPSSSSRSCRGARRCSRACSAPTSSASSGWPTPATSCAPCRQLLGAHDASATRVTVEGTPPPGPCARAIPISIDFAGPRGARASARTSWSAPARSATSLGDPKVAHARRRPARLHQGHPAPAQGLRGAARASGASGRPT